MKKPPKAAISGEKNKNSKLTLETVLEMRALYKSGWTLKKIAQKYKMSISWIGKIIRGDAWKHI